ncbi:MAG: DUF3305 domain-containing protein [Burkholderiales bacterium]|nr:DUF3305 domain-containing protein [Burkholderiales bacterium]
MQLSVLMQRRPVASRWVTHEWEVAAVVPPDAASDPAQARFDGFEVRLYRDEAEGYFLNTSTGEPCAFVMCRVDEVDAEAPPVPHSLTLSYNEAARWMDAQERVDAVPLPQAVRTHLEAWVAANYRPEPKKKRVKASFLAPRDKERL